jgi:signal transduction histidine kinase/CHASE3 domain sensor protein/ActR/RegA family two-component response regulator
VRQRKYSFRHLTRTISGLRSAGPRFGALQKAAIAKGRLVLLATFTLTLISSASMGWFSYRNLKATSEASRLEKHAYLVILEFNSLLSSLKDAESGQRGFVITGNPKYLEPYNSALVTVKSHLATLHNLIKDNPDQQRRLARIEPLIETKLALLEETIRVRASLGFQGASDRIKADESRRTMEALRELIDRAVKMEERLLGKRSILERRFSSQNSYFLLLGNLLGIIILSILYLLLWREFTQRLRKESDLRSSRDLLETQNKELRRIRDERQKMEALLGKYNDLYDFAPVGYFNLDPGGIIRAVNITGAKFLGAQRSSLLGSNLDNFLSDEAKPVFHDFLEKIFVNGAEIACELVFLREGAAIFGQVDAVVSEAREDCRAVIVDISQLKQAEGEKSKLEAQLHQAQKMESVGRLAGGVAHDFNNMLSVIIGQANLALMDLEPGHPLQSALEEIRKAAERSADLTRQLLAFARRQAVAPKVLDLNQAIAGTLTMLKRIIGENIELNWQPADSPWPCKIDPSQLDQILANLCSNSRDSIGEVGEITIQTSNCTIDESYSAHNAGFVPGEYVKLAVSDNGRGIAKEALPHIFEPFFTTKGAGKGTGLGLATVFGAVKQNDGFINVYSEPGLGTTFTIYLPRHPDAVAGMVPEAAPQPPKEGHETILLVEDEPSVLAMATKILLRQGYTVLAANSPGDALRLAREHAGKIALLLTDVVMPEMSGRELAESLTRLNPRLKRLFMSGYTSDIIAHHGVIDEGVHFIQKPFTINDLAAKVRQVLDES